MRWWYFLKEGYAVIFLHRNRSLKPFLRHLSSSNFLDLLQLDAESPTSPVKGMHSMYQVYTGTTEGTHSIYQVCTGTTEGTHSMYQVCTGTLYHWRYTQHVPGMYRYTVPQKVHTACTRYIQNCDVKYIWLFPVFLSTPWYITLKHSNLLSNLDHPSFIRECVLHLNCPAIFISVNNKTDITVVYDGLFSPTVACDGFFLLTVRPEHQERLTSILRDYERVRGEGTLLGVEFQSLSEYLHLLQVCATCLQTLGRSAMLYLAAAVADFYIPPDQMVSTDWYWRLWLSYIPALTTWLSVNLKLNPRPKNKPN